MNNFKQIVDSLKNKKVFLGGTCNGSNWRDEIISKLKIDYFNPVVENWTPEDQEREIYERQNCDFCLYVITPKLTGLYAIYEIAEDSIKRPDKTIFCFLVKDEKSEFNASQLKSLQMIGSQVKKKGAKWFNTLNEVIEYLNGGSE